MMRTITVPNEVAACLDDWKQAIMAAEPISAQRSIGWPGGSRTITMHWIPTKGFWVAFDEDGDHYWNPCGLESPLQSREPKTVCDISVPKFDLNKRVRCAFGSVGNRRFILHRGGLGRGGLSHGMTRGVFFQHFGGENTYLDGSDKVAIVAELGSSTFLDDLAGFLNEYKRLRDILLTSQK